MTSGPSRALRALAIMLLATSAASAGSPDKTLEPYQMVRSLQLVQDRIADGDHAALPMQKKLLELIDGRLRSAAVETLQDSRNFNALMIYAMSGGNPQTVADVVARVDIGETDRQAAAGVLGYLLGDMAQARTAMATIDPNKHPSEVAAFLSLVKGSVTAGDTPEAGLAVLDQARLLSPGTLVEEAALRRIIALAVTTQNVARFASATEQYARRYLRSPYATQFAESLVSGIVALRPLKLELAHIEQTTAWMSREQARTVYLRLARRAAIDGDAPLLEFASRMAQRYSGEGPEAADIRGELYSTLSSVTTDTVDEVLRRLGDLDAAQLSSSDRALLDAATAIATEVVAPVNYASPAVEPELEEDEVRVSSDTPPPTWSAEPSTDPLVTSARTKLEAIDRMLEENAQ